MSKKSGMFMVLALVATGVAVSAAPEGPKSDPLDSNKPLIVVPGCVSESMRDEENKTTVLYKRERQCEGETPRDKK